MLELIIWIIFFPIATTLNAYFSDKNKIDRGEAVVDKEIREKTNTLELVVFLIMIIILISK